MKMESTKDIDRDIQALSGSAPERRGLSGRKRMYVALIAVLILAMFLFGVLTRPRSTVVAPSLATAVLETPQPKPEGDAFRARVQALHEKASRRTAVVPNMTSTATSPALLTISQNTIGHVDATGAPVPVVGTYVLPKGWFGSVRLISDGKEIGSAELDARTLSISGAGKFSITPAPLGEGVHRVEVAFDAVASCLIFCAQDDKSCQLTNVNSCVPSQGNYAFLTYSGKLAETVPPPGSCVTKTFVAGPKYSPEIPEDYDMCARGMWNADLPADIVAWGAEAGLSSTDIAGIADAVRSALSSDSYRTLASTDIGRAAGSSGPVSWTSEMHPGDIASAKACTASVTVTAYCQGNH